MSVRKVTGLPLPETPREAPPEIHGLVDAIEKCLGDSKIMEAALALGRAFDFLTRYFAAASGVAAQALELGGSSDVASDFEAARQQLKDRLLLLGDKSTDPLSKMVRSVFFVGATRKTPTPRRHARLLDLGGIPIRGYLNLGDWIALEPGTKELADDSKANKELLRYLPILKEWLTATSAFFLDSKTEGLHVVEAQKVAFSLTLNGQKAEAGPLDLPASLLEAVKPHLTGGAVPVAQATVQEPAPTAPLASPLPPEQASPAPTPSPVAPPFVKTSPAPPPAVAPVEPPKEPGPAPVQPAPPAVTAEEPSSVPPPSPVPPPPPTEPVQAKPPTPSPTPVEALPSDPTLEMQRPELWDTPKIQVMGLEEPETKPEPAPAPASETPVAETPPVASATEETPEQLPPAQVAAPGPPQVQVPAATPEPASVAPIPEPAPAPVAPIPTPQAPAAEELSDPVVAALNPVAPKPEPAAAAAPEVELYPVVTGPPPEFFDEIEVESDYPEVLTTAFNDLNGAIESNDSVLICGQMQRCFDLMIQFFAGLAGAILYEIDEDALFDFDVEDGRFDLEVKIDLIVTALSALEEFWESNDSATLVWSVFYDTLLPATDPNCAYLHTRLLGVEGLVPDPFLEFVDLCQVVPGEGDLSSRQQCREIAHRYLPILSFWLENAMPLFLECEVDFVDEEGGDALSWAATVAGTTLDGTSSGFWLEVSPTRWNLPRPELAPVFVSGDAPEVLLPVFDELNTALEQNDFDKAGLQSRIALDFLLQYFTGCAASLWRQQGEMTDQALKLFYPEASLSEKERLLILALGGISTESEVGLNLSKLFSKGSLQYRALAHKGHPDGMEHISAWASKREPVAEAELLLYLPLLRSWIGAANPWFVAGEQLFEEPSEDGILEGVVAYGDDFLEMVDPEYVIQLARECLELVAPLDEAEDEDEEVEIQKADTPFTGKLPQLPILMQGPPVLVGHVSRLMESANDRRASNAWLGSSFEYLIQYFAGLCTTVLGGQEAPLPRDVLPYFSPQASLRERELLLLACVEHLKKAAAGSVQEAVRDIFLMPDGSYRSHTKYLGALGAGSLGENEMLLSYWSRIRHQAGHLSTEDLHFGTSVLNSWLEASKPFFASCEHYAEDPGADGQEEMVVELADDYLDMVLPDYAIQIPARGYYELLYKESDADARADVETFFPEDIRPSLLGPQEVVLGGAAGASDELLGAAVDLGGADDLFTGGGAPAYDADDLFAGSVVTQELSNDDMFAGAAPSPVGQEQEVIPDKAPTPKAEAPAAPAPEKRKKKKKRSKKQELGSAVLALYKKERLEKARKRAEARARKAEAQPSQLKYTLEYRGLKNSKQLGGRGHFGLIELTNVGGGELKGTVEPAHPCVRVSPTRFEGNQVRVVYQVDPADMPSTGRTGLSINTQDERILLRLDRLVPTSWWNERTTAQAIGILTAPSLVYSVWVLALLALFLGPSLEVAFKSFGNTKLEEIPWSTHMKAWVFAMLAILPGASGIPALLKWFFAKFDYTVQEETRMALIPVMMLPSVVMAGFMYGTNYWVFDVEATRLPLLGSRLVIVLVTFGLNLLATGLFHLQTTMWWEERADESIAKKAFLGYLAGTVLLGVIATFFMW